jgi:hypothetical protein
VRFLSLELQRRTKKKEIRSTMGRADVPGLTMIAATTIQASLPPTRVWSEV